MSWTEGLEAISGVSAPDWTLSARGVCEEEAAAHFKWVSIPCLPPPRSAKGTAPAVLRGLAEHRTGGEGLPTKSGIVAWAPLGLSPLGSRSIPSSISQI